MPVVYATIHHLILELVLPKLFLNGSAVEWSSLKTPIADKTMEIGRRADRRVLDGDS
jgi:hypothetical protein